MVRLAVPIAFLGAFWDITCNSMSVRAGHNSPAYLDSSLSPKERAADLLQRMTWEEKVGQLGGVRRTLTHTNGQAVFNKTAFDIVHKTQNGQIGT